MSREPEHKPQQAPSDRRHLLFLLDNDECAWAMLATWPNVNRERLPKGRAASRRELVERWSALAGYREVEVNRAYDKLFGNGFIDDEGRVDADAERYVEAMIVAKLPREVRPKRKQQSADREVEGAP